jgi:hypothetical protein
VTYNHAPRRRFTKAQRAAFLVLHGGVCYWCEQPIEPGQPWDIEHLTARELLPDASADADENLAPIHAHPMPCHKIKSRRDKAMIAKSNRIRRAAGPVEDRRDAKHPIRSRGFQQGARPMVSRPFPKRGKP